MSTAIVAGGARGLTGVPESGRRLRVAVVHWSNRLAGGAETSLLALLFQLHDAGHEVGLLSERDQPHDRERMSPPPGTVTWCVDELGTAAAAVAALRAWSPDIILVNITFSAELEAGLLDVAPAVLIAHAYHGTCISGLKAHQSPRATPCGKEFGLQCLAHFYPRRCGGLNPLTMMSDFRRNQAKQGRLARYRAIVTYSAHMRSELARHVPRPERVHVIPMGLPRHSVREPAPARSDAEWHLLFTGRMDRMKGGATLLEALPAAVERLGRPVRLTMVGDGPERARWEALAAEVVERCSGRLAVSFTGWLQVAELEPIRGTADLLVVPSLWPEPFGMVGPEAGLQGVPAVAFAVGGIPEWLHDGVNGYLAPGDPPTAAGLSEVIVRALSSAERYGALRRGAVEVADRFNTESHLAALLDVFERALAPTT